MASLTHNSERLSFKALPKIVKAIPYLAIFKVFLSLVFFAAFTLKTGAAAGFPMIILYTSLAYAIMLLPIFYFLHKKHIWGLRATLVVDFLVSIPASAFIGFAISLISLGLTFSPKVKNWFSE